MELKEGGEAEEATKATSQRAFARQAQDGPDIPGSRAGV